jgi:hypothetical protein
MARCSLTENADLVAAKKDSLEEFNQGIVFHQFQQNIISVGFTLVKVLGDGNCFFHTLVNQLHSRCTAMFTQIEAITSSQLDHQVLRKLAIGALIKLKDQSENSQDFERNLNDYIADQNEDGTRSFALPQYSMCYLRFGK